MCEPTSSCAAKCRGAPRTVPDLAEVPDPDRAVCAGGHEAAVGGARGDVVHRTALVRAEPGKAAVRPVATVSGGGRPGITGTCRVAQPSSPQKAHVQYYTE